MVCALLMFRGHALWLLLKQFSTIRLEAVVIISGSGLVKVLDATFLIQLMDTLFFHADTDSGAVRRRSA